MNKGILIAGNDSALTSAIENEAVNSDPAEQYAITLIKNRFSETDSYRLPGAHILEWNPGSPISARTLVLAAENRLGIIDKAILVCDPPCSGQTISGLGLADIEIMINDHIKGWFYLVKELTAVFRERGEGILALVYPEHTGKENTDLLGNTALAAFRSFAGSLLAVSAAEPYLAMGFAGGETGDESGFASFIFKQFEERNRRSSGKLFKYGKLHLFK